MSFICSILRFDTFIPRAVHCDLSVGLNEELEGTVEICTNGIRTNAGKYIIRNEKLCKPVGEEYEKLSPALESGFAADAAIGDTLLGNNNCR